MQRWKSLFRKLKLKGLIIQREIRKQTVYNYFIPFWATNQKYQPLVAVDYLMNNRPRPKAEGDSSPGGPQNRGKDRMR